MSSSAILELVRALRAEAGDAFDGALATVATLVENVLEHPSEEKYRSVRLANAGFQRRLGRFASGLALLRNLGFEEATQGDSLTPTHLAIPEADPSVLSHGLVLVTAARQANDLVAQEQHAPTAAAAPAGALTATETSSSSSSSTAVGASSSSSSSAAADASSATSNAAGKRRADAAELPPAGGGAKRTAPVSSGGDVAVEGGKVVEEEEVTGAGTAAVGSAVELSSYSAADIDAYFLSLCGGPFLEGLGNVDAQTFARLCATARDAQRVTGATGDGEAQQRAAFWASALDEQGRIFGWSVEEVASDDEAAGDDGGVNDQPDGTSSGAAASEAASSGAASSGAAAGGSASGSAPPEDDEPVVIAADGNFDSCAVCGIGGLLYCCEACPQAYHRECLGPNAPPDDDDDDAWFCPPCAEALGMGAR